MRFVIRIRRLFVACVACVIISGSLHAGIVPPENFQDLRWRLLGPLRGGWATCAEGVPDEPNTFYFGAADGGVWRTTDAGLTWESLADSAPFSSVETLAIAPGATRTIYVGSGQVTSRYDAMDGTGVYKTEDEGKTWTSLGLSDTRHIGRILLDPRDSKVILVAALGHLFGPNAERGVFRSADGGQSWQKVLFVNEDTGAVDLASDPTTPEIIYAALWQARLYPWLSYFLPHAGPGSGIWKSTDGGNTWTQTSRKGLPTGDLSRIGLAVASGANGQRVYASVASDVDPGFYRSDDGGASWKFANADPALANTYFGRVTADPTTPDVVYVMGVALRKSDDGGKTFVIVKGTPGGDDYHHMWMNPKYPDHRMLAADQGATVTVNGGKTWSLWHNQATGQFYRLSADNRFPYRVYSGQQDCGTVAIATRSDYGRLTFRDWHSVGGDERDYDVPDPEDPNIVYGAGLGGAVSRWDARTGRSTNISPWPFSSYGLIPTTVKYRYNWITPLAMSNRAPYSLYLGAQLLFRSVDKGQSWEIISPDLTGADSTAKNCDGEVPTGRATVCGYGTIHAIAPSPLSDGLLWVGTDNGRIHLTRDDGKKWNNVTPAGAGDWSKIAAIDASSTDAATAYVAVDRRRLDDLHPYIYRSHNYGQSWDLITHGLPESAWVNVVRQDPSRPGLLYAGTRTGVFVSWNDGDRWQPLQLNLPRTSVNDLLVHDRDLIAATQGRALWLLDDVTPLRQMDAASAGPALVSPAAAVRVSPNENRDTPLPPEMPATLNPPTGAIIDYFLPQSLAHPIELDVLDENGSVVRKFRSDDKPERTDAEHEFTSLWLQPTPVLPARAGHNRFVWNLLPDRPASPQYEYSIAATPGVDTPALPQGMQVLPGRYTVKLIVEGKTLTQPLLVEPDPRSGTTAEDLRTQSTFYNEVIKTLGSYTEKYHKLKALDVELGKTTSGEVKPKSRTELRSAQGKRELLARFFAAVDALNSLTIELEKAEGPPTAGQRALYAESIAALQNTILPVP